VTVSIAAPEIGTSRGMFRENRVVTSPSVAEMAEKLLVTFTSGKVRPKPSAITFSKKASAGRPPS
jgi:hypothetical protein